MLGRSLVMEGAELVASFSGGREEFPLEGFGQRNGVFDPKNRNKNRPSCAIRAVWPVTAFLSVF